MLSNLFPDVYAGPEPPSPIKRAFSSANQARICSAPMLFNHLFSTYFCYVLRVGRHEARPHPFKVPWSLLLARFTAPRIRSSHSTCILLHVIAHGGILKIWSLIQLLFFERYHGWSLERSSKHLQLLWPGQWFGLGEKKSAS